MSSHSRRWPIEEVTKEAILNTLAQPGRLILWLFVLSTVSGGVTYADLASVTAAVRAQDLFTEAGGYIVVARDSNDPPSINAARCRDLAALTGIRWAGVTDTLPNAAPRAAPNWTFRVLGVDQVVAQRWGSPPIPPGGLVLGQAAALDLLGSDSGSGSVTLVRDYPISVVSAGKPLLNPVADRAILGLPFGSVVDECWIEAEPWAVETAASALAVAVGVPPDRTDSSIGVTRWLREREFDVDPIALFASRPTRAIQIGGLAVLVALGGIDALSRRRVVALYRSVGWTWWDWTLAETVRWTLVSLPAAAVGITIAATIVPPPVAGTTALILADVALLIIGGALIVPTMAASVTLRRQVAHVLRST